MELYHGSLDIVSNPEILKKMKDINQSNLYLLLPGKILAVAKIYSQQHGGSVKDAMAKLYQSNTYRMLEDESTKLWHYGPVALYQEFMENN